ncbi:MAG: M48 family peptidase [Alphaproteobacteria bacterium]|nr:M48 family peptidase [Alphaproteobacteria bacterium]
MQHPNHSSEFWRLLKAILPDWQKRKNYLEKILM